MVLTQSGRMRPTVLTIGPSIVGGAGVQLDLLTFASLGVEGAATITRVQTNENSVAVPQEIVASQTNTALNAGLDAVVIHEATASAVEKIRAYSCSLPPFIVADTSGPTSLGADVAVSTAGADGLPSLLAALAALRQVAESVPCVLEGRGSLSRADVDDVLATGAKPIWLDGADERDSLEVLRRYRAGAEAAAGTGEAEAAYVVDVVRYERAVYAFVSRTRPGETGRRSVLAGAIAAHLALEGRTLSAVTKAVQFVRTANALAGPRAFQPDLAHAIAPRLIPPSSPQNPHPFVSYLIGTCPDVWESYVRHPFVVALGNGSLPTAKFQRYIIQDYHYLQHYARAHSLGAFKSATFADIQAFTEITSHVIRESSMHVNFCESFGVSLAEILATPESTGCGAYARFIMDVGAQGDVLDLYVAVFSCLIGYGEVGLWLRKQVALGHAALEGNPYRRWIEDYSGEAFLSAVDRGIENLERRIAAEPPSPARLARLAHIWQTCVRLEADFWEG